MNNEYGINYKGGFVSVAKAAATLGMSRQAMHGWIRSGKMPSVEGEGVPIDAVNRARKERVRQAWQEYERLTNIPELS